MLKKVKKAISNPKALLLYITGFKIFRIIPDKLFLKIRFRLFMDKKLDLVNPKTFNEKLQWLKLYDRKDEYTKFVDKYEVRNHIEKIVGGEYLIPLFGIYNKFDEINFDELPNQFVLKATHTSGDVFICKNKSKIDIEILKKKIDGWLCREFYYAHREWPYKNVKPRIICEKYMSDNETRELIDYKFMCFNGEPKVIQMHTERFSNHRQFHYDISGAILPFNNEGYTNEGAPQLDMEVVSQMMPLARKLAKGLYQIRVDFYYINKRIYFGELTFFDAAGFAKIEPEEYDYLLGSWIQLPINDLRTNF